MRIRTVGGRVVPFGQTDRREANSGLSEFSERA